MPGPVDEGAEQHQQTGHQGEHRQKAQKDRLDQHDGHVHTDGELHEAQGRQSADGGQGGGADLRNGLAQGGDGRLPGAQSLMLVGESVAQYDGVVDGQSQLQHHGDGIGDEADLSAQVVGAHVHQGRRSEGQQQHRHLHIGPGGQHQHQDDDDHGYHQDGVHLLLEHGVLVVADGGVHVQVVAREGLPNGFHGLKGDFVGFQTLEADVEEGGGVPVVVGGIVKGDHIHPFHGFQHIPDLLRGFVGDVVHHHPGGAEGGEIGIHGVDPLPGLRVLRQIGGHIVLYLHPVHGKQAENQREHVQQEEQIPLIDDEGGQLYKKAAGFLLAHRRLRFTKLFTVSKLNTY